MMSDCMRTTNNVTLKDIEDCKGREELRTLIVRRQPTYQQKIEAGGALNYLNQAYNFITIEEQIKAANK